MLLVCSFVDENKINASTCSEENKQKACIIIKDGSGINQNAVKKIKKYRSQNNHLLGRKNDFKKVRAEPDRLPLIAPGKKQRTTQVIQ